MIANLESSYYIPKRRNFYMGSTFEYQSAYDLGSSYYIPKRRNFWFWIDHIWDQINSKGAIYVIGTHLHWISIWDLITGTAYRLYLLHTLLGCCWYCLKYGATTNVIAFVFFCVSLFLQQSTWKVNRICAIKSLTTSISVKSRKKSR